MAENRKAEQPYLEYFAAACEEFHSMGAYEESTDLTKITQVYREYLKDPESIYMGPGLGIIYHDSSDPYYDQAEVTLIRGKTICGNELDNVPFLTVLPMVRESLERICQAFPEFRYISPQEIREALHPEKMTAEQLAEELNGIAKDYDVYDYWDCVESESAHIEEIIYTLQCGEGHQYIPFLRDVVEEECLQSSRAAELINKIRNYEPEQPAIKEPMVQMKLCEDAELAGNLMGGGMQKLSELDKQVADMDRQLSANRDPKTDTPAKTVQMYFVIYYADDNKMQKIQGRINIGDGSGGIIGHLKAQNEIKLNDESWIGYQKSKGEESFRQYMNDLTDMQDKTLPYLQSFCSVEEKGPHRTPEPPQIAENKATVPVPRQAESKTPKAAQPPKDEKEERKSIHERLEINKRIIQERQGKDKPERGADRDVSMSFADAKTSADEKEKKSYSTMDDLKEETKKLNNQEFIMTVPLRGGGRDER